MEINVNSINYQFGNNGETESIEVGFQGNEPGNGFLNTKVILKVADGDLDDMTRKEIGQAARTKMAGWFTETGE